MSVYAVTTERDMKNEATTAQSVAAAYFPRLSTNIAVW